MKTFVQVLNKFSDNKVGLISWVSYKTKSFFDNQNIDIDIASYY